MAKHIHYTTVAELAERMGHDGPEVYGTFPARHEVIVHQNGQALTLDGGVAVELESDAAAVKAAFAAELEAARE